MKHKYFMLAFSFFIWGCDKIELGHNQSEDANTTTSVTGDATDTTNTSPVILNLTDLVLNESDSTTANPIIIDFDSPAEASGSVDVNFDSETAVANEDYLSESQTITFSEGDSSITLPFSVIDDALDEFSETLQVTLSNAININLTEGTEFKISIDDNDLTPTLSFELLSAVLSEETSTYRLNMNLSASSGKPISVELARDGLATYEDDYLISTGMLYSFSAGSIRQSIDLTIVNDDLLEGGETIILSLTNPTNTELSDDNTATVLIMGDRVMVDTGSVSFYDGTSFNGQVEVENYPGQDAAYGDDTGTQNHKDGHYSQSFTHVDFSGNQTVQGDSVCITDNRTGLTYEKKQPAQDLSDFSGLSKADIESLLADDDNSYGSQHNNFRAANYRYYYRNTDNTSNGGDSGPTGSSLVDEKPINGLCAYPSSSSGSYSESTLEGCNTSVYINYVNSLGMCGFNDWRLPHIDEQRWIHNYNTEGDHVDSPSFFPYLSNTVYLSQDTAANENSSVWCFDTTSGQAKLCNKHSAYQLRLVRGN